MESTKRKYVSEQALLVLMLTCDYKTRASCQSLVLMWVRYRELVLVWFRVR